jgi:hypothetical protein
VRAMPRGEQHRRCVELVFSKRAQLEAAHTPTVAIPLGESEERDVMPEWARGAGFLGEYAPSPGVG